MIALHEGHDQDRRHEIECEICGEIVRCPEHHHCLILRDDQETP